MIEQASLVLGNGNWAVKSDSLLGYKTIDGKYYPRDFTFTRATTGTRVNEAGLIEIVPYNLLSWSEEFDNAAWSSVIGGGGLAPVRTANAAIAPDGTLTADQLFFDRGTGTTASSISGLSQSTSPIAETCTGSIWIKAATSGDIGKQIAIRHRSTAYVVYTLTDEWVRVSSTQTGANLTFDIVNRATFTADVTVTVLLWGAQLVEGTNALPYQRTETRLNIPRIDYSLGSCPSLLVEPQRTNLALRSEEFDNASWVKTQTTVTVNSTISPSGVQNADTLIENSANSNHFISQQFTKATSSLTYSYSIYFKNSSGTRNIAIAITNGTSSGRGVVFSSTGEILASNVTIGTGLGFTYISGQAVAIENGWYKANIVVTTDIAIRVDAVTYLTSTSAIDSYLGNGTSGYAIWGAQLEAGAYATSYIPTTTASVTRNLETVAKTGVTALIGQTEGTLFLDVIFNGIEANVATAIDSLMLVDDGTINNIIGIALDTPSSNPKTLFGFVRIGGAFQALIYDSVIATNTRYKIALAYKANDVAFYINGQLIGTDTSVAIPTTSSIRLTQRSDTSWANDCRTLYNAAALWKTRLTNDQLAQLTTI